MEFYSKFCDENVALTVSTVKVCNNYLKKYFQYGVV